MIWGIKQDVFDPDGRKTSVLLDLLGKKSIDLKLKNEDPVLIELS